MFGLFNSKRYTQGKAEIQRRLAESEDEIVSLRKERNTLKDQVEDLKLKKKIEEEDIKHMMKIKDESLALEYQRKELKLQQEKNDAVAKVKDEYRDKTEAQLNKRGDELKAMYGEILQRLPNVNMEITQKRTR
jgi:hypothetical protein